MHGEKGNKMPRLIDADMLEPSEVYMNYGFTRIVYMDDIDEMPTIDAVEVVRCKDCQYYYEQPRGFSPICELTRSRAEKEAFCSWGKKKDE